MTRPPTSSNGEDNDLKQRLSRLGEEVLAEDVPERLLRALAEEPQEADASAGEARHVSLRDKDAKGG